MSRAAAAFIQKTLLDIVDEILLSTNFRIYIIEKLFLSIFIKLTEKFNPWNTGSFWSLKNRVGHIWQKTLTGSREMKNIVLGDESPMTLSEMP